MLSNSTVYIPVRFQLITKYQELYDLFCFCFSMRIKTKQANNSTMQSAELRKVSENQSLLPSVHQSMNKFQISIMFFET